MSKNIQEIKITNIYNQNGLTLTALLEEWLDEKHIINSNSMKEVSCKN